MKSRPAAPLRAQASGFPRRITLVVAVGLAVLALGAAGARADNSPCIQCHGDKAMFEGMGSRADSLTVTDEQLGKSVHTGFECITCHADLAGVKDFPHGEKLAPVECGQCHGTEKDEYQWHGRLKVGSSPDIPTCAGCHGMHDIAPASQAESRVNSRNLPFACGRCHENVNLVKKYKIPVEKPVEMFETSIHGQLGAAGSDSAATCSSCHSAGGNAHKILSAGNSQSTINHFNIPNTCSRCHAAEAADYWAGIHGQLTARGDARSPVCTDCHGEHGVLRTRDPRSPVSPNRVAEATCAPCHDSARLNERYRVGNGYKGSRIDSYHGVKSREGDLRVANCASCHTPHRILPESDPASSVNPANLQKTCGRCHHGISSDVSRTPIHGTPGVTRTPVAGVVARIYILLIAVVIGGMAFHWLIDFLKQVKLAGMRKQIRRMTTGEVWQHTLLMVTFIALVITGFALRFAKAWWVQILFGHMSGFRSRGIIHRWAAAVFMATVLWHVGYLFTERGRKFFRDMLPRVIDARQALQMMAYNLGRTRERPRFGRFGYVEKAEYWALVWGTVVMIGTGLCMWMESSLAGIVSQSFLDVVLIVHYYEAWLATLAIAVWHSYSTIFSPSVYPGNPAWVTGRMPEEAFRHEHPDDPVLREPAAPGAAGGRESR